MKQTNSKGTWIPLAVFAGSLFASAAFAQTDGSRALLAQKRWQQRVQKQMQKRTALTRLGAPGRGATQHRPLAPTGRVLTAYAAVPGFVPNFQRGVSPATSRPQNARIRQLAPLMRDAALTTVAIKGTWNLLESVQMTMFRRNAALASDPRIGTLVAYGVGLGILGGAAYRDHRRQRRDWPLSRPKAKRR